MTKGMAANGGQGLSNNGSSSN